MSPVNRPDPCFLDQMERVKRRGRPRWRNKDGSRLYEWDELHGEIEVYNRLGHHLGVLDAGTGRIIKGPVRGRRIDV